MYPLKSVLCAEPIQLEIGSMPLAVVLCLTYDQSKNPNRKKKNSLYDCGMYTYMCSVCMQNRLRLCIPPLK